MKKLIVIACSLLIISCTETKKIEYTPEQKIQYEIASIIASNKITNCTEFTWQQPGPIPYEYIVQCSSDGFNWKPYFVRTKQQTIEKGTGPTN